MCGGTYKKFNVKKEKIKGNISKMYEQSCENEA